VAGARLSRMWAPFRAFLVDARRIGQRSSVLCSRRWPYGDGLPQSCAGASVYVAASWYYIRYHATPTMSIVGWLKDILRAERCCLMSRAPSPTSRAPRASRRSTSPRRSSTVGAAPKPSSEKRESAERENPSLPGDSGGVPLNLLDFPRAGGWEQPRSCCADHADAAHHPEPCPLPLYNIDRMFYNSRARDPAFSAAARRRRRSINTERRPLDSPEKIKRQTIKQSSRRALPKPMPRSRSRRHRPRRQLAPLAPPIVEAPASSSSSGSPRPADRLPPVPRTRASDRTGR